VVARLRGERGRQNSGAFGGRLYGVVYGRDFLAVQPPLLPAVAEQHTRKRIFYRVYVVRNRA
jgi:hypothetical protein